MSSSTLTAEIRSKTGSRDARQLRAEGRIPASVQGGKGENVNVSVDAAEFWAMRRHHVHLFDLEYGGKTQSATIRELQWDSLGDELTHIEFRRVKRGVKTEVTVQLAFLGHPSGGVLNHLANEIEVKCLPSLIPDAIEVNVDGMEVGHTLTAGEIALPEGFELASSPELPVAVVSEASSEIEETPAEEGEEPEDGGEAPAPAPEPDAD